jgi:hypothetical protein
MTMYLICKLGFQSEFIIHIKYFFFDKSDI